MKPVIYNDVLAAVSFVASHPRDRQELAVHRLFLDADQAEQYALTHNAPHPVFGNGSLMAAALRSGPHGDTSFQSKAGLEAWIHVLSGLRERLS